MKFILEHKEYKGKKATTTDYSTILGPIMIKFNRSGYLSKNDRQTIDSICGIDFERKISNKIEELSYFLEKYDNYDIEDIAMGVLDETVYSIDSNISIEIGGNYTSGFKRTETKIFKIENFKSIENKESFLFKTILNMIKTDSNYFKDLNHIKMNISLTIRNRNFSWDDYDTDRNLISYGLKYKDRDKKEREFEARFQRFMDEYNIRVHLRNYTYTEINNDELEDAYNNGEIRYSDYVNSDEYKDRILLSGYLDVDINLKSKVFRQ